VVCDQAVTSGDYNRLRLECDVRLFELHVVASCKYSINQLAYPNLLSSHKVESQQVNFAKSFSHWRIWLLLQSV
jgi:hypothetical protein